MAQKSTMLFDVLKNILSDKSMNLYQQHISSPNWKDAAKFIVIRYLGMHSNSKVRDIILDNYVTLERMPDTILYKWLILKIPKQKMTFIKYLR